MSDLSMLIVIASYNTRDLLRECLASIPVEARSSTYVVDNASGDGSAQMVRDEFSDVTLLANSDNIGFARAVNQALDHRSDQDVLLLNPDATLADDCLQLLSDYLQSHPDVGIVAPLIVHPSDRLRVLSAGRQPTSWRLFSQYSGLSRWSRRRPWLEGMNLLREVHGSEARDVEWVSGACLLIRGEALSLVGKLSERWFMYAEDLEFCWRVQKAGYRIVHLPSARVWHHVGASSSRAPKAVSTMWVRSLVEYHAEAGGILSDLTFRGVLAAGMASRAAAFALLALRKTGDDRDVWQQESKKFRSYARAALTWGDNPR